MTGLVNTGSFGMTTNTDLIQMAKKYGIPLNAVVSKSELTLHAAKQGGYIINLDDGAGSHWVALWISSDACTYFDSFGVYPPQNVLNFVLSTKKRLIISRKQIQNIQEAFCGQYCLDFLDHMNRSKRLRSSLSSTRSKLYTSSDKLKSFLSKYRLA